MKCNFKIVLGAAALVAAFSVNSAQRDITVTADIDVTADVTQADGSSLPQTIAMQYLPSKGLNSYSLPIKFWSNNVAKDLNVSIVGVPELVDVTGSNPIPLTVSINRRPLSIVPIMFTAASTFPSGILNGSSVMPLDIAQATPAVVTPSGNYSGVISLVVTHAP